MAHWLLVLGVIRKLNVAVLIHTFCLPHPANILSGRGVEALLLAILDGHHALYKGGARLEERGLLIKYCGGNPLLAETIFGWGRQTVAVGLAERRTGIRCLGAQAAFSGRKRWAEQCPENAEALRRLAEAHTHYDPTFRTTLAYTRLTANAALEALRAQGYGETQLPSPSTMAEVHNRLDFRLCKVVKAKPQKKIAELHPAACIQTGHSRATPSQTRRACQRVLSRTSERVPEAPAHTVRFNFLSTGSFARMSPRLRAAMRYGDGGLDG